MQLSWKSLYSWIQSALGACRSPEEFCQQAIAKVAATYAAEGWLWVGLENPDTVQVYCSTPSASEPNAAALPDSMSWLTEQHPSLQTTQLHTGDLVIPVIHPASPALYALDGSSHHMALQLRRPPQVNDGASPSVLLGEHRDQAAVYGWSAEELNALEIIASQMGLAYELFLARQHGHQSRQQIALLSRTAYLLNSSLPIETQLMRLLTDWGHCTESDRGFVVRLRDQTLVPLALWKLDTAIQEFPLGQDGLWQDAIDLFEDGAASHLELYGTEEPEEPQDALQQWLAHQGCQSGVLMPIRVRGQLFGMVGLLSAHPRVGYRIDELQTLRQATEQLAIALGGLYQPPVHHPEAWGDPGMLYDPLTGCETRAALEQTLEQMRTRADWTSATTSVILCDLDYFKLVNDTYGHSIGDQVLQAIAHRLQAHLRHPTRVYRYGGEEFAVILSNTPQSAALRVAERLRWAVGDTPIKTSAGEVSVTASFGVAQQPPTQTDDSWVILHEAEAAIQDAKRQGRNQVIGR